VRVAVLSGGISPEHDVSLSSGRSVSEALSAAGHEVVDILITREGGWMSDGHVVEFRPGGGLLDCGVAFPVLHGPGGEDGSVQAVFEVLDIAYVGSGVEASAICMDKLALKSVAAAAGIPQVPYREATVDDPSPEGVEAFEFPLWVKPAHGGSSLGISRVEEVDDLPAAVELAASMDSRVIIEGNSPGKEVECSVLGNRELITSRPGELRVNADWYDYEAKYQEGGMDLVVPADLPDPVMSKVEQLAAEIFRIADCRGMARCDFFVEGDLVLLNEVNTIPGFTPTSVYATLLEQAGLSYSDLCNRLLELAVEEKQARDARRS
jgi:D-alanine-D-alanine ligase